MYTGREYALTEGRKCPWGVNRGLKLYYNRARYYNPQLGRFISRDPIDIADDVNLYAYVGNNSVMFVDLMGMEKDLVINKKTLERINGLHPFIRESVEDFVREVYKKLGVELFITDGFRTFEEQNELYNQGRYGNAGSVVTWAKGGYSYHNYGLGFDVSSLSEDGRRLNYNIDWNAIGKIGKDAGFEWGGDWKGKMDRPHFQETYQYTTTELLKFVQNGKIDSEGYIEGYALFEIE